LPRDATDPEGCIENTRLRSTSPEKNRMSCKIGETLKADIDQTLRAEKSYPPPGVPHEPDEAERLLQESTNARIAYMEHRKACSEC